MEEQETSVNNLKITGKKMEFVCSYNGCKKTYRAKQHLVRHVKVFHCKIVEKKCITCDVCQETFSCKQNLSKHILRKHGKDFPFKCKYCPKGFKKKNLLASHLYQHNGTKLLSCNFCDKKFATQTERGRHQSKHKTFTCECEEKFSKWSELLEHKKKQHSSTVFECDTCHKVFKNRAYIVRHMKIHTLPEERLVFVCPLCPNFYTFKSNLIHHINSAHDDKTYNCRFPGCTAKLSTKSKLDFHFKLHTNPPLPKKKTTKPRKKRKDAGKKRISLAERLGGVEVVPNVELEIIETDKAINTLKLTNDGNSNHRLNNRHNLNSDKNDILLEFINSERIELLNNAGYYRSITENNTKTE